MKEQIKELRVKIDGLSQLTKELKPWLQEGISIIESIQIHALGTTKEIEKTYDSLILAKAWLGKVLEELGENTPYINDGKRKTVKDIEPASDTSSLKETLNTNNPGLKWFEKDLTHIEKVDWLRQEIRNVQKEIHNVSDCGTPISGLLAWNFIYQHLCEARFWLEFELQRIKENGNNS